jgi:hypothetical protein
LLLLRVVLTLAYAGMRQEGLTWGTGVTQVLLVTLKVISSR